MFNHVVAMYWFISAITKLVHIIWFLAIAMMIGLSFFSVTALWSASLLEKCHIGDFHQMDIWLGEMPKLNILKYLKKKIIIKKKNRWTIMEFLLSKMHLLTSFISIHTDIWTCSSNAGQTLYAIRIVFYPLLKVMFFGLFK